MTQNNEKKAANIRILLVDDEEGYVDILSKRMTKRGFFVKTALSGSDAIQKLRKNDFDVAVLDLKMKDYDGIEVLKIFKKMLPSMEVIMLTGHGSERAAREGKKLGVFAYLSKPIEIEELSGKIIKAYKKKSSS